MREKGLVKKHQNLVRAKYTLPLLSVKIIGVILSTIRDDDKENKRYVIKASELMDMTGRKGRSVYEDVRRSLDALLRNPITIPTEDGFIKANWIAGGEYRNGELSFMIYPGLRPFLFGLKERFLKYELENILHLSSSYSIKVYELLKDFHERNKRYNLDAEMTINLKELREMLDTPASYKYNSFKKNILEKSQEELAAKTDIGFSFKEIKEGRKITKISFKVFSEMSLECKKFEQLILEKYAGGENSFGWKTIDGKEERLFVNDNNICLKSSNGVKKLACEQKIDAICFWNKIFRLGGEYSKIIEKGKDIFLEKNVLEKIVKEIQK